MRTAFCDGIFVYADEATATRIIEESTKICGASHDTLSHVLQTKFFAKHTPFYWTIISRHSNPDTPPLLTKLFEACALPLTKETQEDILAAFYACYDSDLYLDIKDKLPDVPSHVPYYPSSFDRADERPILTAALEANSSTRVKFAIPRFLNRLVVDDAIVLEFLAIGAMTLSDMYDAGLTICAHRRTLAFQSAPYQPESELSPR